MPDETYIPPKTVSPPIAPQIAKQPPADIAKMEFKLDSSISNESDPTRITVEDASGTTKAAKLTETPAEKETRERDEKGKFVKKEESAKVEETKEEVVKEEVAKEEPTSVLKAPVTEKKEEKIKLFTPPSKEAAKSRDYSGFSVDEQRHLKQMSNEAFEYVTGLIAQTKDLSKLKDASFLQHPEAYTLSPEYKEAQSSIQFAVREGNYWRDALVKVKKGEPIVPLTGWDDKGNPILGAEIQPNEQVEEAVRAAMNNCFSVAQQKQGALGALQNTFQDRTKNDLGMIQSERAKRFAWVADPKLMDYTLPIDGMGDMSIKQIKQTFTEMFPPYLRNNAGVEVASDLFVALRIQSAELAQALNGKQVSAIKEEEQGRAEPSSENRKVDSKPPVGKVKEFSLAGLPA